MDDKSKKGPTDRKRVNIHEDYEVAYWTEEFNCTREELTKAVHEVGTSSDAVKKYLVK